MIEVKNLTKTFDPIVAVNNISFKVDKGEVLGFLGPNGAGKTTTMKMLTCFILPTEGEIKVDGDSVLDQPVKIKKKIGYMSENAPLYDDMSVFDFLSFVAKLREIPKAEICKKVNEIMKLCVLEDVRYQRIETLSKGYRRRLSMAQALIHDPEILILDEPTDGLDPNQKSEVRNLIRRLSENKCIILSTHILEEVEAVCTRAIIISEGSIKFDGTPAELKGKSSEGKIDDVFRVITTEQDIAGVTL